MYWQYHALLSTLPWSCNQFTSPSLFKSIFNTSLLCNVINFSDIASLLLCLTVLHKGNFSLLKIDQFWYTTCTWHCMLSGPSSAQEPTLSPFLSSRYLASFLATIMLVLELKESLWNQYSKISEIINNFYNLPYFNKRLQPQHHW